MGRIALLIPLFASLASCASLGTCGKELTREDLTKIVQAEGTRLYGSVEVAPNREVQIKRRGCDYIYIESDVPDRPGGSLVVIIDEHGNVKDYIRGM